MATLVLTAVGSVVGGPIGGAIGAAIGQQIDGAIFAPKPREGARLKELAVQTSSYGSQIPAIFGVMRVAGTVFWATDLVETRSKSGGGKGRPSTVQYSYSISMAVALSSRPISRVGRIWADGNLLRGSAGDLKVDGQLRIYNGDKDQMLDPLIAAAEASGQCPAYRGTAYAMFEDLQLADYGNRIPSLTFEIFERETDVAVDVILDAVTGGAVRAETALNLRGFAVSGNSARETLGILLDNLDIELVARDGNLLARKPVSSVEPSRSIELVGAEGKTKFDRPRKSLTPASAIPHIVSLRYYDSERDFQASLQRSERGAITSNLLAVELPAVLVATQAQQIVDRRHLQMQYDRNSWQGDIAVSTNAFLPGDCFVGLAGDRWRIDQIEHRLGSVAISARACIAPLDLPGQAATPGRNLPAPDLVAGETRIAAVEMPIIGSDDPGKPILAIFAAGTGNGWRRAALSLHDGSSLIDIGVTAAPAIIGVTLDPIAPHNSLLIDESATIRVQLLNGSMDIAERAGSPLEPDAPLFWTGGEFIRVGVCQALGGGVFRLSRLQRGCFQSALEIVGHTAASRFVLIQPDTAKIVEDRIWGDGNTVVVEALGLADASPVSASASIHALATRPPAPVHGTAKFLTDNSAEVRWIRRSRIDLGWRDGVDQILAEEQEQYLVSLFVEGLQAGEWSVFENSLSLSASQLSDLGVSANGNSAVTVSQIGRYARSEPLAIEFP